MGVLTWLIFAGPATYVSTPSSYIDTVTVKVCMYDQLYTYVVIQLLTCVQTMQWLYTHCKFPV